VNRYTTSPLTEVFRGVIEQPAHGVVGLVDDLLRLCQERGVQLDWQADCCRLRPLAGGSEEVIENPLRKSLFRAVLARVAAVCNERAPNPVSPYGGQAELTVGANPATTIRVNFTNTPGEQRLELTPVRREAVAGEARNGLG
jgi:hypothetical protein